MKSPPFRLTSAVIVTVLILAFVAIAGAQPESQTPPPPQNDESSNTPLAEIEHTPPAPGWLKRVNDAFGTAVKGIETVFFYRLGQSEQQFVVYEQVEYFVRDRGAGGVFVRHDPNGSYPHDHIDDAHVDLLAARQELLKPESDVYGADQLFRFGRIGDREIEYISVVIPHAFESGALSQRLDHGDKLILVEDRFVKETPRRGLLSTEARDSFSREQVEQLAALGFLGPVDVAGAETSWLRSERVGGIPFVVAWLAAGGVFFTIYMRGFNFWGFKHAINIVRGKYDDPEDQGEVTHFQALSSALSGTVGLGNIAGVTIAMTLGGPGAFLWMLLCGFFGMTMKFVECTLGVKYRLIHDEGTVHGGPMRYLKEGLKGTVFAPLGVVLAFLFTLLCILASFGGGNMLQANQSGQAMQQMFLQRDNDRLSELNREIEAAAENDDLAQLQSLQQARTNLEHRIQRFDRWFRPVYGAVLAALVAVVIIGGIKRIGKAAEKIVPAMCLLYVGCCLYIVLAHVTQVPAMIALIFTEAFTGEAMRGGLLGVLVIGVQRAAFSNEAGAGSAAIAHSAAKTDEPIREGCVALLEPFIDTIVVCSMTALAILITGAWDNSEWVIEQGLKGSALTSRAFQNEVQWFPILLSISVTLFAYSTIISWSYYGEQSWEELFGYKTRFVYKILAVTCVFVGTVVHLGAVLDFSDMMILGMAFPNITGLLLLAPKVRRDLQDYWKRLQAGEFRITQ